jgi:bifunctional non-homologous end joining protein LigD
VAFAEFTAAGVLRHGAYLGLRADKEAKDVVRETAAQGTAPADAPAERHGIRLTHPERVLFPEQGLRKQDLADYYAAVADRLLPHLARRPLSLVRCPQGRARQCFFQKHDTGGFPDAMKRVAIEEGSGKTADYFYLDDLAGLLAGVQMGVLEFHGWGCRIDRLEQPDRLVFDLDPDEGLGFAAVRDAAFQLRDELAALGLRTVPMVTGGKGVHVVAPLVRRAGWAEVKALAKGIAGRLAAAEPARFTATMAKAKRQGRIFIDWLRNERGATAIAPYSTRARKGAPVATPVAWDELAGLHSAATFTTAAVIERIGAADPWAAAAGWRQSVTAAMVEKAAGR